MARKVKDLRRKGHAAKVETLTKADKSFKQFMSAQRSLSSGPTAEYLAGMQTRLATTKVKDSK